MITRVQMLGRGGQGVKSAAHIVGTAAFLDGYYVQDQPLYGAERRGAPITAFIRISSEPILERGHELGAALSVIADDSLLEDPSFDSERHQPSEEGLMFVNSAMSPEQLKAKHELKCKVITFDLTKLAVLEPGKASSLSAALAGATANLLGLSLPQLETATKHELQKLWIGAERIEQNLALARAAFNSVPHFELVTQGIETRSERRNEVIDLSYHGPAVSACTISTPGNTVERKVGSWNRLRPRINYDKCTKCMICFVYCPDSAITLDKEGFPHVDYDACKGCDICHRECPVKAISLVERAIQ